MFKTAQRGNILIPVLVFIIVLVIGTLLFKSKLSQTQVKLPPQAQETSQAEPETSGQFQEYTSQDLKISFNYPKGWFVDEEYPFILIANFDSSVHDDSDLKNNKIEIMIKEFSLCLPTLEEDLVDPACGQGKQKNKIISKEVVQTPSGEFLKYNLDSYDENQRIQYFFRNDEKILDIEKRPDPSQFEKEFEEIINSMRFL